jgi:SMC interacting uncharacterized protein involved in chromosome segregation
VSDQTKPEWTTEYERMLSDCEKRESRMTEWEQSFIDSLSVQIGRGRIPSAKQIETLERIWEKVTANG